ncbi:MAG: hypothetical protein WB998_02830 [Solirubrobacteraceae bacterium]
MRARVLVAGVATSVWVLGIGVAAAQAVTPGWECIPTTAGQAVISGGTGGAPSCGGGTTAVLAPTYVASGVGGKPTVEFSALNVQIVNGMASEATTNGEGNLIVGYDEKGGVQTGSHNLLLGGGNSYSSYGGLIAGTGNSLTSSFASVLGGSQNVAGGGNSTVLGGYGNRAASSFSTIGGGCSNLAGAGMLPVSANCSNTASYPAGFAAVLGGSGNQASATAASASGGDFNLASDPYASVDGGCRNLAGKAAAPGGSCAAGAEAVLGGTENTASALEAAVSGGSNNNASVNESSILGGEGNTSSTTCQAIPAAPIKSPC